MTITFKRIKHRFFGFYRKYAIYKSQKGQDKWVVSVHANKKHGFFVDLAAADGITNSNTYVLETRFAWNGICIEANPSFIQRLERTRNCVIEPSVVSDREEMVLFRVDNGQYGGIVAEDTDNKPESVGYRMDKIQTSYFKTTTLTEILERHQAPTTIDYLSLDVEGSEERVLLGIDLQKYTFLCLSIERPTPKVNEILKDNNYIFVKNRYHDSFYIHPHLPNSSSIHCDSFVQVPPKAPKCARPPL